MAIKIISIACPACNATLDIEENRQQLFCSYCGTKIVVQNDHEYVYRHIDEAQIKQAETNQMIELKRLEMEAKRNAERERITRLKIYIAIALGLIVLISFAIGGITDSDAAFGLGGMSLAILAYMGLLAQRDKRREEERDDLVNNIIQVPSSIGDYEKKDYTAIETIFIEAGFTNVRCVPLHDLTVGWLKKEGTVESITINGQRASTQRKCSRDAAVIISYHSF